MEIALLRALDFKDLCITPSQHEMRAAPAEEQPGVAIGQSVLAWRLGYAEVFLRVRARVSHQSRIEIQEHRREFADPASIVRET